MAEVRVAKSAGFCYGVERAVKLAEETAREKGGCAMLGSIIHNVHVVAELEALGARQVDSVEEVRPGETVIIRSHGERKEVFDRLEQLGSVCVNAIAASYSRGRRSLKMAPAEAFPAVSVPDGGGSDHLHPNNLGNFQRNFKNCVQTQKSLIQYSATHRRQLEAAELAAQADVMVVVGDRKVPTRSI